MVDASRIAGALERAAESGDVPGVRQRPRRRTASFSKRLSASAIVDRRANDHRYGRLDRLDDQGDHRRLRYATGRAGKLSLEGSITGVLPDLAVCRCSKASTPTDNRVCGTEAPDHAAPVNDTHVRPRLRHVERRYRPLHRSDQHTQHHVLSERRITLPLASDPGEKWEYGIAIDWVGKAVEAVSGQILARYMQETIFNTLGMTKRGSRSRRRNASAWPRFTPVRGRPGLDGH